jgi:hypothetical protein
MDRDSVERLRFDRRLQRRDGWVDPSRHQAFVDELPDVSEKMTTCAEEEEAAEAAPIEAAPAQAPIAGEFSTPSPLGSGITSPAPGTVRSGSAGDFGDESGGN